MGRLLWGGTEGGDHPAPPTLEEKCDGSNRTGGESLLGSFYGRLKEPESWLGKAESHLLLAERLWADLWQLMYSTPASQREKETTALTHGVAFFVATAIENGLKARIVQRRPELVAEKLSGPLVSHDLPKLAVASGAHLEPAERDLLAPLTEYLMWAARYPGPRKAGDDPSQELGFAPRVALDLAKRLVVDYQVTS